MEEFTDFNDDDDCCSVDERAEKFIERFYEEIKLQRQQSFLEEFNAMVDSSWKTRSRDGTRILSLQVLISKEKEGYSVLEMNFSTKTRGRNFFGF